MSGVGRKRGKHTIRLATVALMLAVLALSGCGQTSPSTTSANASGQNAAQAWAAFRKAVAAKDDTAVYAALSDSLRTAFGTTPTGASSRAASMLPTSVESTKRVSSTETWMIDALDTDNRVELGLVEGVWRIKTISSNTQSEAIEKFTPAPTKRKTTHLPTGKSVTISNPQSGTRKVTYSTTTVNGVAGKPARVGEPVVVSAPTTGELWVGTGGTYHGSAGVSQLRVGKSHDRYGVSNTGSVLNSTKVIAIGFRLSSLPKGSGVRAVLLDSRGVENVGDAMGAGNGAGWTYWWQSQSPMEPGGYVAVVEVDSKPAVWKAFWVK